MSRAGSIVVGLSGLVLVVAGAGYGTWVGRAGPGLLGSATSDLAVAGILLVIGLVANLVTVADGV